MFHSPPAGLQGEAIREKIRVVSHRLVRGQLVQDKGFVYQLHRGADDRGRRGPRHH